MLVVAFRPVDGSGVGGPFTVLRGRIGAAGLRGEDRAMGEGILASGWSKKKKQRRGEFCRWLREGEGGDG